MLVRVHGIFLFLQNNKVDTNGEERDFGSITVLGRNLASRAISFKSYIRVPFFINSNLILRDKSKNVLNEGYIFTYPIILFIRNISNINTRLKYKLKFVGAVSFAILKISFKFFV